MNQYFIPDFDNTIVDYKIFGNAVEGSTGKYTGDRVESKQELISNVRALQNASGLANLSFMNQKHTNIIKHVDRNNLEDSAFICDGQVTKEKGIALIVMTADCVPILFFDEDHGVLAAAHAGWRGAKADVVRNTIDEMRGLGAVNISAIIGPCIRQESYEVDTSFYDDFRREDESNEQFFVKSNINDVKYLFDLPNLVKGKLTRDGIAKIYDCGINTYTDESLFSFRRFTHKGGYYGSNVSMIYLKND